MQFFTKYYRISLFEIELVPHMIFKVILKPKFKHIYIYNSSTIEKEKQKIISIH